MSRGSGLVASVVVNNHNYERFVADAVESALGQTYPKTEVVVVDDGSTDGSRDILEQFRGDVELILKPNAGQRSAFNAGFERTSGDFVCFLDADDTLDPTAIERAADLAADPGVSKVHWALRGITADGIPTGEVFPPVPLADGDLRERTLRAGPDGVPAPPTSGNAWARRFLERVMPMPEVAAGQRNHADAPLFALALLYGEARASQEVLGSYRLHGNNIYATLGLREQLERTLSMYADRCRLLAPDCDAIPFPERDGVYWGLPADDAAAVAELDRERRRGVRFLVFAWQTFWWLDHYAGFAHHVARNYRRVLENDRLQIWVDRSFRPGAAGHWPDGAEGREMELHPVLDSRG